MSVHEFVALVESPDLGRLSDDALLARQRSLVVERRRLDAALAALAGEIARRSDRSLGYAGLAARRGVRTPERLIQREIGVTAREAADLVRAGSIASPELAAAVAAGTVSVAAAAAIDLGLGATGGIPAADLTAATEDLIAEASRMTPEELLADARAVRARFLEESVVDRERALRAKRSLRLLRQDDGMTRLVALLDPESAAFVVAAVDAATSPRRGGPRAVAAGEVARVERLAHDPRTTEQLALDAFVELIRLGAEVEPGAILGARRPAVRIHVTDADLARRAGIAAIEGRHDLVSVSTAERHICAAGTVPIRFDSAGQVVDVGRERRLYTARQRIGLAARDGGCRWPGCERPPSWCEAHHIDEWHAHHGSTDLADGVLLCRFHHLMVHDQRWRIRRGTGQASARYEAIPPATIDRARTAVALPSKQRLDSGVG